MNFHKNRASPSYYTIPFMIGASEAQGRQAAAVNNASATARSKSINV
jgi:hypothetical protein